MAKAIHVNIDNTWKKVKYVWENVDGTWKKAKAKVNISGVWKDCCTDGNKIVVGFGNNLFLFSHDLIQLSRYTLTDTHATDELVLGVEYQATEKLFYVITGVTNPYSSPTPYIDGRIYKFNENLEKTYSSTLRSYVSDSSGRGREFYPVKMDIDEANRDSYFGHGTTSSTLQTAIVQSKSMYDTSGTQYNAWRRGSYYYTGYMDELYQNTIVGDKLQATQRVTLGSGMLKNYSIDSEISGNDIYVATGKSTAYTNIYGKIFKMPISAFGTPIVNNSITFGVGCPSFTIYQDYVYIVGAKDAYNVTLAKLRKSDLSTVKQLTIPDTTVINSFNIQVTAGGELNVRYQISGRFKRRMYDTDLNLLNEKTASLSGGRMTEGFYAPLNRGKFQKGS